MKLLIIAVTLAAPLTALAGPAEDIDAKFAEAAKAEKEGDCGTAAKLYREVQTLALMLKADQRKQVDAQAKARLQRTKDCAATCELSDRDKSLFDTAKQAVSEPKRVAELCKQILHGKNTRCKDYAEIRAFCPTLASEGDPCKAMDSGIEREAEALGKTIAEIATKVQKLAGQAQAGGPKSLNQLVGLAKELDDSYDRLFELREATLNCDNMYAGLAARTGEARSSRKRLQTALVGGYKARTSKLLADVNALKKSNDEAQKKIDDLAKFTDEVFLDVLALAEGESLTGNVKIEGKAQPSEAEQQQLAKVLAGDREAVEQLLKERPDYFDTPSGRAGLAKKRDNLQRLSRLLEKYNEQGRGEGLGFSKASDEVRKSLAVIEAVIGSEDAAAAEGGGSGRTLFYGAAGALAAAAVAFFIVRNKRKGPPTGSGGSKFGLLDS